MADTMKIEILKDGSLKVTTDEFSEANHFAAEEVLRAVQTRSGGETPSSSATPGRTSTSTITGTTT